MGLRDMRERAGKTVLETALALGISGQAVYWWEWGKNMPSASNLVKLADFYCCTVDELLRKDERKEAAGD